MTAMIASDAVNTVFVDAELRNSDAIVWHSRANERLLCSIQSCLLTQKDAMNGRALHFGDNYLRIR